MRVCACVRMCGCLGACVCLWVRVSQNSCVCVRVFACSIDINKVGADQQFPIPIGRPRLTLRCEYSLCPCTAAVIAAGAAGTVCVRWPASRVSTTYRNVRADAATRVILRIKRLHNRAVKLLHRLPIPSLGSVCVGSQDTQPPTEPSPDNEMAHETSDQQSVADNSGMSSLTDNNEMLGAGPEQQDQ